MDETFLFHNRHKVFWAARDAEHRLILDWSFSHNRDTSAAYDFLKQLGIDLDNEKLTIVTDGFRAYQSLK